VGAPCRSLVLRACSCRRGGRSLFVGGWSKWAVVVIRTCFVLLFVGARDGGSLFFVCGRARFLSWWAVVVCGWLE
jgi:hypothetical protein